MFNWAITFLIIAIVAGVLGFGGIAGASVGMAKIAFVAGLVFAIIFFLLGRRGPPV
jgi:uncharacterized membrane protein YtjA (UPF0391 family)